MEDAVVYVDGLTDKQKENYGGGNGAFCDSANALENCKYFNRARLGWLGKNTMEILYP